MEITKVTRVHFSPSGTTRKTAETLTDSLGLPTAEADLLQDPSSELRFGPGELAVFCLPVFAGRLPGVCLPLLRHFTGDQTPAIAVVVYGNRDFDDALLELCDLLRNQGFVLAGAAAVVAQHSIFPQVAAGRPNGQDQDRIRAFGGSVLDKLRHIDSVQALHELEIPGNRPYCKPSGVPLHPHTSSACIQCGTCSMICPTSAIPAENGRITNKDLCITCTACISACPVKARSLHSPLYSLAGWAFAKKCASPRQPLFIL